MEKYASFSLSKISADEEKCASFSLTIISARFQKLSIYETHVELCSQHTAQSVVMPSGEKLKLRFKSHRKTVEHPITVCKLLKVSLFLLNFNWLFNFDKCYSHETEVVMLTLF